MSAQRISESADLGADWQNQSKKEDDDHLNHPTNVAIREAIALKEKGNADFGRHSYDEAVDSYAAGAAAAATVEGNYRAQVAKDLRTACLCNAAQARLKQERWLDASELCTQALSVDGRCVKALFRRGCAHLATKDYDKARRDLELAAEIEPKNQSIASKLVEAERSEMQDAKKSKGANDYDRFAKIELSDDDEEAAPAGKGGAAPEPRAPPRPPPRAPPPPRAAEPAFEDASAEAKPAAGYRYWAQSKSAPRVVPQKIDPALVPAVEAKGGGSVWNAAGTYEERDQTDWAKQCLAELLASPSVGVEGGGTARCTGAKDVQGDAGVHVVRGKKRFVFDLRLSVPFEVELPASAQLFTGEVELTDFSSHEQADWESHVIWNAKPPPGTPLYAQALGAVGKDVASAPAGSLCAQVATQLLAFIAAFKQR